VPPRLCSVRTGCLNGGVTRAHRPLLHASWRPAVGSRFAVCVGSVLRAAAPVAQRRCARRHPVLFGQRSRLPALVSTSPPPALLARPPRGCPVPSTLPLSRLSRHVRPIQASCTTFLQNCWAKWFCFEQLHTLCIQMAGQAVWPLCRAASQLARREPYPISALSSYLHSSGASFATSRAPVPTSSTPPLSS